MIVFPNCKINIGLDVTSRRSDGYHELRSIFFPVKALTDVLEVVEADRLSLTVTGNPCDCPAEKNLVMKAYSLIGDNCQIPPVEIHLHKVIPDGAGLGGGSADAAFMLLLLNDMFSLGLSMSQLEQMAVRLGADVPFFLHNRPMLVTGIGEKMEPVTLNMPDGMSIALIKPAASVSTREAYSRIRPSMPDTPDASVLPCRQWQQMVKNDFEPIVASQIPEMVSIKEQLLGMGALYAAMSGSGSAVYGLFLPGQCPDRDSLVSLFPRCFCFAGPLNP